MTMSAKAPRLKPYVFGIIYKVEEGVVKVLVQSSRPTDRRFAYSGVQVKFPGGQYEYYDSGDFIGTLAREIAQETELRLRFGQSLKKIHDRIINFQHRIFYLVSLSSLEGDLRREPIRDGNSILGVLRWVSLVEAKDVIWHTHSEALEKAERELSRMYPNLVR